ncbi:AP-5 complex subunit zeta-1-like isoform X2 [Amphiura filiformis]|uniref:AP-5 complex subunit zeta-1-like isoform X2 n=1 Tax=Amphiura filiformis TaxID=82378 RepID=UPI003B224C2B
MSAPSTVENILSQFRGRSHNALEKHYTATLQSLQSSSSSPEFVENHLRTLLLCINCTKKKRKLPEVLLAQIVKALSEKRRLSWRSRILCSNILQDYGPTQDIQVHSLNPPQDLKQLPHILPVLLNQGQRLGQLDRLAYQMVRWVSTVGFDSEIQSRALASLVVIGTLHGDVMTAEQIYVLCSQVSDWLSQASLEQAANPHSKQKTKKMTALVTEIDGALCQDFFTVLNLSQFYGEDHLLNVHSFSVLRSLLHATLCRDPDSIATSQDRAESPSDSAVSFLLKAQEALIEKACEYCLRVIDQCERRPARSQDLDLVYACLIEAISTLDVLCSIDSGLVPKLFPSIKRVCTRITEEGASQPRVMLSLLQFFINHSNSVVHDPQLSYHQFFGPLLGSYYDNQCVAMDTIIFCRDNLEHLCENSTMERYFPNLLKILAWNPISFLAEFIHILPSMISSSSAVEMLHTILDLPCMTAALVANYRAMRLMNDPVYADTISPAHLKSIEGIRNPDHKPLFTYICRNQSGQGDTISKLNFLHSLLHEMESHPRVMTCAESVPILLKLYFNTILEYGDQALVCQLIPVILERAGLLYQIPAFQKDVRKVLSEELVSIFKQCPSLIIEERLEILDYVSALRHITGNEDFFLHVVWVVGEYTSTSYDKRCSTDTIIKFYEALETLLYEISVLVQSTPNGKDLYSVRLMTVMMTALAKLASRCQDLIPRVLLCLTKIAQQQTKTSSDDKHKKVLLDRANELINLLKLPDIASAILGPPPDINSGRWHTDNITSIPILLQAASKIVPH